MKQEKENRQENKERRVVEFRAEDQQPDSRTVTGYAALFNSTADLGWFHERIDPGAFDGADMSDVRALFNHDPNYLLARTSNNSLTLAVDERGLKFTFQAPNTTVGNDLLENIRSGLVSQCSFAFTVDEDEEGRNGKNKLRVIKRIGTVYDVSPVTYPAYPETTVSVRSKYEEKEEKQPSEIENADAEIKANARKRRVSLLELIFKN